MQPDRFAQARAALEVAHAVRMQRRRWREEVAALPVGQQLAAVADLVAAPPDWARTASVRWAITSVRQVGPGKARTIARRAVGLIDTELELGDLDGAVLSGLAAALRDLAEATAE